MAVRLHRPADDRIVDMMRSLALRAATHVVVASLGDIAEYDDGMPEYLERLPDVLSEQLRTSLEAVEQVSDLHEAESLFETAADAVTLFAGRPGTGVHAMLFRRDGTVELALPNAGVQTIRSIRFPGFEEIAA